MSYELQTLLWIVGGVVAAFLAAGLVSLLALLLIPAKYRRHTVSYRINHTRHQNLDASQAERDLRHIRHLQDMEYNRNLHKK